MYCHWYKNTTDDKVTATPLKVNSFSPRMLIDNITDQH